MSVRWLIKLAYVAVIISSIFMSKYVSENFIYITKTIFWFESIVLILAIFTTKEKMAKNWTYSGIWHLTWNSCIYILAMFFIAYQGWFVLLGFYVVAEFIALIRYTELDKMVKNKESSND